MNLGKSIFHSHHFFNTPADVNRHVALTNQQSLKNKTTTTPNQNEYHEFQLFHSSFSLKQYFLKSNCTICELILNSM